MANTSDPSGRPGAPPAGTPAGDLAAWARDLEAAHDRSGTPQQTVRVLTQTLVQLRRDKRHDDILALLDAVPAIEARNSALAFARLMALEQSGRIEELKAALGRVEVRPGDPNALFITRMRGRHNVADPSFETFYGPLQRDLGEILRDLPVDRWDGPRLGRIAEGLYALAPDRPMPLADYRRRYVWGHVADTFLFSLMRQNTEDPAIRRLRRQIRDLAVPFDPVPLVAAEQAGRSILFARAHAGINAVLSTRIPSLSLPDVLVERHARAPQSRSRSDDRSIRLATGSDLQTDFLKLVKRIRKAPHQITIYPDGPDGGEHRAFTLLGHEVQLGMGAAMLAWHGKAATFFLGTRWQGERILIDLVEGPVADGGDRDAFEDAFHRFYLERLEAIALGPPEDIVGRGGVWRAFLSKPA